MYKVPFTVLKECTANLETLVNHIEENCDLTKPSTKKRLKRAKKNISLLKLNYYV